MSPAFRAAKAQWLQAQLHACAKIPPACSDQGKAVVSVFVADQMQVSSSSYPRPASIGCLLRCIATAVLVGKGPKHQNSPTLLEVCLNSLSAGFTFVSGTDNMHDSFRGRMVQLEGTAVAVTRLCSARQRRPLHEFQLFHACRELASMSSERELRLVVVHAPPWALAAGLMRALLKTGGPCSAASVVLLGTGTHAGRQFRRQALSRQSGWKEVAHVVAAAAGSSAAAAAKVDITQTTSSLTSNWQADWSIIMPQIASVPGSGRTEALLIYCYHNGEMLPVTSVQRHTLNCQQCCVGPRWFALRASRKHLDERSQNFQWQCMPPQIGSMPDDCVARIRRNLACMQIIEGDMHDLDWLRLREQLHVAVRDAREGIAVGLQEGLLPRIHRLVFEAEHGKMGLGMNFQELSTRHLLHGLPNCLIGQASLQMFMLFFVDTRTHGLWAWEQTQMLQSASRDLAKLKSKHWQTDLAGPFEQREPLCILQRNSAYSFTPDILVQRLRILRSMPWMQLLDSGWPIFKIVSLLTHDECMRGRRPCMQRCPDAVLVRLMRVLEARVAELDSKRSGRLSEEDLHGVAMVLWSDLAADIAHCGELLVVLVGVSCAVAMARTGHTREALTFVALAEVHFTELLERFACAYELAIRSPQLWEILGYVEDAMQTEAPHGFGQPCLLNLCPYGGSPSIADCRCVALGLHPGPHRLIRPQSVCVLSTDPGGDRPLERNLSRLVASTSQTLAEFWSITHHLNRLYARLHGYRFFRPELDANELDTLLQDGLQPRRRLQWAIVRLVQRQLDDRSCRFVVWLDSDAFVVSSEPLEAILRVHGLLNVSTAASPDAKSQSRVFFFASAAAASQSGLEARLNISDHFMVVRNTPAARNLLGRWWRLPLQNDSFIRFRQELFLEQTVMNDLFKHHPHLAAPPPPLKDFEGISGRFVRHVGGIKDHALGFALRDALVARILTPVKHPRSPWARMLQRDPVARRLLALLRPGRYPQNSFGSSHGA